jgi:hypothetical protein
VAVVSHRYASTALSLFFLFPFFYYFFSFPPVSRGFDLAFSRTLGHDKKAKQKIQKAHIPFFFSSFRILPPLFSIYTYSPPNSAHIYAAAKRQSQGDL